jgi:ABC-type glutathione transport system ATPase component
MRAEGRTIIFVSHDTNSVKRMCNTAMLLERGEILLQGAPNDVANIYTKLITSPHGIAAVRDDIATLSDPARKAPPPPPPAASPIQFAAHLDQQLETSPATLNLLREERAHQQISDKEYAYGGELGRITTITLCDARDTPRLSHVAGAHIRIRLSCLAAAAVTKPIYAVTIKDVRGQEIFGTNTYFQNQSPPDVSAGGETEACFDIQLNLQPGVYFISAGWVRLENGDVVVIHRRYDAIRFDVLPRDRSFGIVWCPAVITTKSLP